ncbi:MAG: hypothetical protein KF723_21995 [Rhizobiaceae bacterium]|nr:hypothetical protein [Rhizobiaceae bacterium]
MILREANDFVEKWHRHSARTSNDGGKFAIGLEHEGELVGVAIVGRPIARLLQVQGAAELLRLCTSPSAPKGSGSKLYSRAKRIWQLMGGTKFHTYTLAKESGDSMRGAGLKEPVVEIDGEQWDRRKRRRSRKPIHDEPKRRWSEDLPELPL